MPPERLPPLNSLRAFNAAARHMSFQNAAAELFVTPAALSYQIRNLEDYLGVKLFNRLNRAVELTEHGSLIAPGIREGFARLSSTNPIKSWWFPQALPLRPSGSPPGSTVLYANTPISMRGFHPA